MSDNFAEFRRRLRDWQAAGDSKRLKLGELYSNAWRHEESDPEHCLAMMTQARDEARRLNEPWWDLFFENQRLMMLSTRLGDNARALPLAMDLVVRFNSPEGQSHPDRQHVMQSVVWIFEGIDPIGFRDDIENGMAYLDGVIENGPVPLRLVLDFLRISYLDDLERWDEAYDCALRALDLVNRSGSLTLRCWHGAWALFKLCQICHALGRREEIALHAGHMDELAQKLPNLKRVQAEAALWQAYVFRAAGDEKNASRRFSIGMNILAGLGERDSHCAHPLSAYYEAGGDVKAAVGVQDRRLAIEAGKGSVHLICEIHVERCRLLASINELAKADISAAAEATNKLRDPDWFLEKIKKIAERLVH